MITGDPSVGRGAPAAARTAGNAAYRSASVRVLAPRPGSRAMVKRRLALIVNAGPSQATGRVQPRRAATVAISQSEPSNAAAMSRVWTAPAAWRNVPEVVTTGKTRVVTVNVMSPNSISGT